MYSKLYLHCGAMCIIINTCKNASDFWGVLKKQALFYIGLGLTKTFLYTCISESTS
jgi:hypothetical protein